METKANYALIGAFTLAGFAGALALLLWFAQVQVDRQYAYFDILFDDVAGLGSASDVRYNGLPVGQVVDLAIDEADPSMVRVQIEVDADTPVNTETVAQLQSQGVTGVSFVALRGGSVDAAPLPEQSVIPSERSAFQSVLEGAPELLDRAVDLLENVNEVFDEENRTAVSDILSNLASSSERLDGVLEDAEALSSDIGAAAREVAAFSERLESLADTADGTLNSATEAFETASTTMETANSAIEGIDEFRAVQLTALADQLQEAIETANRVIDTVGQNSNTVVERIDQLGEDGRAALEAATQTFENADATLADISTAMGAATETLGTANQTFSSTNTIIEEDLDAIVADLRGAAEAFTGAVTRASTNIDSVAGEVLAASESASNFLGTLERGVAGNERQLSEFLRLGLPEFLRLTEEARSLVVNLERLASRIERDPARFFLGTQNSEFRR